MNMNKRRKYKELDFDFAVVGGGMTGICAAIAAARHGARTVLIQDRPVLGGNASSEIRMHICGASANRVKRDAEETGILHEILLDNKRCNDYHNFSIWDNVLFQKVKATENLSLLLNCSMQDVDVDGDALLAIYCYQLTTEINYKIKAHIFADCSGNGTLCYFAGAEYRSGCEGKSEFNEPDAPENATEDRMGSTLLFKAVDRGHPVEFRTPGWARKFTEDDLKLRRHGNSIPAGKSGGNMGQNRAGLDDSTFARFGLDYGYWWIELPGEGEDYVSDFENVRDELVRCVYGVWDHLKNGGDHGAENMDLQWVGMLPGVRESRRVVGKYILTENDILENRRFPDAVAYGGWPIDNHAPRGLYDKDIEPSFVRQYPGFYTIPYRCYLNDGFKNLMQAGRILSASKLAMASSRVMGTCAVGGQAVGTAAAMCIRKRKMPFDLLENITELQQELLKDDCYIPGVRNEDSRDLARSAKVYSSSALPGSEAENVINGISRSENGKSNAWESDGISEGGETLSLDLQREAPVSQLRLSFDSNLNRPLKITLSAKRIAEQQVGVPAELVKDFSIRFMLRGKTVAERIVQNNYQRHVVLDLDQRVLCDRVEVLVTATNGYKNAKIFEIRVYDTAE